MKYTYNVELNCTYEEALEKTKSVLKEHGFGVLSEIDVHEKFKEKLNKGFRRYKILGACSPEHAYRALQVETHIGAMLPCNVVVQEHAPDKIEVSAIDPVASMQAIENPELGEVAQEVQSGLKQVIADLSEINTADT
jgi:uncharacterized protein (DUF302 family)